MLGQFSERNTRGSRKYGHGNYSREPNLYDNEQYAYGSRDYGYNSDLRGRNLYENEQLDPRMHSTDIR